MKEPICPEDSPERYAQEYIHGEEHAELFDKMKSLHDYCQEKNIPMLCVAHCKESNLPVSLFHIININYQNPELSEEVKQDTINKSNISFFKLVEYASSLLYYLSGGKVYACYMNNKPAEPSEPSEPSKAQEDTEENAGEEWKDQG